LHIYQYFYKFHATNELLKRLYMEKLCPEPLAHGARRSAPITAPWEFSKCKRQRRAGARDAEPHGVQRNARAPIYSNSLAPDSLREKCKEMPPPLPTLQNLAFLAERKLETYLHFSTFQGHRVRAEFSLKRL
jgi:hypothetical protein